jgi:outer membrane protein OmpA-like peptidoglycan-associated protein
LEENVMRTTLALFCCVSLIVAVPAQAADASKEEKVGVGTGALVGAAAGGPIGFLIGAAIGAKAGDTLHQKNQTIEELDVSLQATRKDMRKLNANYDAVNDELSQLQAVARPDLISMLEAGIAMDILFRTDESVLADTNGDRLAGLGRTVAGMTDVQVQLDGFADERGDETYNHQLSEQRVAFVRDQLIAAGVHPSRIRTAAHGESPAQDTSVDSYALERRVSLKLYIDDALSVAQIAD